MFILSHAPVVSMPPPVILSTLPPPLNTQPCRLLSAVASPPVCLSFAGWLPCCMLSWLSHCMLSGAYAWRHISLCSRLTHPSSTPFFVCASWLLHHTIRTASASRCAAASRLAVLSPSPMRRHRYRQCTCVFAVVTIAIAALVACR
jgi:hypothetical protein